MVTLQAFTQNMTNEDMADVLCYTEIESHIENLQFFPLEEIGTIRWFNQHEMLEKLNLQALCEAKMTKEEKVCDRFLFFQKSSLLVEILIAQNIWAENVFPHVLELINKSFQAFPTYMVLFHSVTAASLLETLTFNQSFCQALDDSTLDLLDFCHSLIGDQITRKEKLSANDLQRSTDHKEADCSPGDQLKKQKDDIDTILSAKAIGILSHLTQHASSLPLSVTTRMCHHHDLPVLLAGLLQNNPWTMQDGPRTLKLVDGQWRQIMEDDRFLLTQTEGQMWIALHQSLLNPEFTKKYHLNQFRKNRLLKVQSILNEMLLDQLPVLVQLQRYLHSLMFMETPMPKMAIMIEQTPVIRQRILKSSESSWKEVAHRHVEGLSADRGLLKIIAERMAGIYTTDNMELVLPQPAKCACCGHPAKKRCSGCKMEWYCRRECQVKQWSKHKNTCSQLVDNC